ncbi:MAG TPA: amidohydrolase family protein [Egibacteraceae bacterium]|nr:amidohydrolase family protein [Egibacteraceae bacterium]
MMIIDAHQHLWDPSRREYPWMRGEELAPLRRAFSEEDLSAVAVPSGVGATIVVQAIGAEEETVDLLASAADSPLIRGVVGWVDLTGDVVRSLARLQEAPGGERLVGVRHQVQDEPDDDWLRRGDVRRGLEAVAAADLAYDLLIRPQHLPAALEVAGALPDLRLVVDHGAKPDITAGEWEPWHSLLAELAEHEHVRCKLSGLVTEADWRRWTPVEMGRYARSLLDLFGPSRVMFGSDWPVCTLAASYAQVLDLALSALEGSTDDERAAVLGGTAAQFYLLT